MWKKFIDYLEYARDWTLTLWFRAFVEQDPRAIGWLVLGLTVFVFLLGAIIF